MKTNPTSENGHIPPDKPLTTQQELFSGGVCEECLNEDFDSCVCPEPKGDE